MKVKMYTRCQTKMAQKLYLFGQYIPFRQLYKGVSPARKNLHQSASSFELAVKHAVCLDKNMLQVFYKNTYTVAQTV